MSIEQTEQMLIQTSERSKSNSHRLDRLEEQSATLSDLVTSVKLMAQNIEQMTRELTEQGKRLAALERQPAERWKSMIRTISTTVISTLVGGVVGALAAVLLKG